MLLARERIDIDFSEERSNDTKTYIVTNGLTIRKSHQLELTPSRQKSPLSLQDLLPPT